MLLCIYNRISVGKAAGMCRTMCGSIQVQYPFSIDDGCGAPQYRGMFTCNGDLEFLTLSGSYKVQNIDYDKQKVNVFSPNMSTCNTLQPRQDFKMSEVQSVLIPPSPDTYFILLNCSSDSPVLHRYSSLCGNFSGNTCDELYSCPAFKVLMGVPIAPTPPPCCSTDYKTLQFLSLDVIGCSHYTTIYNADNLNGKNPLDWPYGIRLSYSLPDDDCDQCQSTGGTCGFNTETERLLCLCSGMNTTRDCGNWSGTNSLNTSLNTAAVNLLSALVFLFTGAVTLSLRWPLSWRIFVNHCYYYNYLRGMPNFCVAVWSCLQIHWL